MVRLHCGFFNYLHPTQGTGAAYGLSSQVFCLVYPQLYLKKKCYWKKNPHFTFKSSPTPALQALPSGSSRPHWPGTLLLWVSHSPGFQPSRTPATGPSDPQYPLHPSKSSSHPSDFNVLHEDIPNNARQSTFLISWTVSFTLYTQRAQGTWRMAPQGEKGRCSIT